MEMPLNVDVILKKEEDTTLRDLGDCNIVGIH